MTKECPLLEKPRSRALDVCNKLKILPLMCVRQNLTMEDSTCMIALFQRDYDPQLRPVER